MFKQKRLEAKKLIYVLLAVIVVIVYFKSVQAREVFSADSYEDIKDGTKISYQSDNDETEIIGYHFNLDKDAKCTFKGKYSTGLTIMFNLIDDNKNEILWSWVGLGSNDLDFSVYLKKGDYYFNLEKYSKTELSLDFDIEYLENSDIENNDKIETAQAIDCGKSQSGAFLYNDYVDVYKFEVPYSGEVTYGVSVESSCGSLFLNSNSEWSSVGNLQVGSQLYDSKGEKVSLSYSSSDGKYHTGKVNAGTYYLEISKLGSNNTPSGYGISYLELCGTYKFDIEIPSLKDSVGSKFSTYEGYEFYKDENGDVRCFDSSDNLVINEFKCDGTYTYYFQLDGTAMKDRLSYHPDGTHIIYFDGAGHEVFSNFSHVKKSIAGEPVDDLCFFDVYGYMYVNVLTFNQSGTALYYANPYGVMECNGWFQFAEGAGGVAEPLGAAEGKWGYAYSNGVIDAGSIGDESVKTTFVPVQATEVPEKAIKPLTYFSGNKPVKKMGEGDQASEFKYDENGNLIEYYSGGRLLEKYEYNSKNNLTKEVMVLEDGSEEVTVTYEYNGNQAKETIYNPNDAGVDFYYIYDFDEFGKLVKLTMLDKDGNVIGYDIIDHTNTGNEEKNKLLYFFGNGPDYIYQFNTASYGTDGSVYDFIVHEYDENGNEIKSIRYYETGVDVITTYEYDANGNAIKSTSSSGGYSNSTYYEYDAEGNLSKIIWGDGADAGYITFEY